ncbi:50S ribosomal protein L10 [Pontibacter sp. BT731]|uniref:Large ribosomal subunit protein uL10 n=1 Tax=Pontibacter amylolyticus TaxID=1424080 RepID=A0ABQ1W6K6_9BACT|nr:MULTISPECIES: 50S ribosomal protein L10 [Pontibacter]MDO6389389.1 50S ribosomal protein L10 [Pontibacter sp. BT731]GGG16732.1 50S ribosomal protein L10 [Pontibacter amylolyticus]
MTREEKEIIVKDLSEKLANTNYFYITDASTMSVAGINQFRRMAFERGLEYKVYKNTFIKKALDTLEADTTSLEEVLKGSSGIVFSAESGNAPGKLLKDFRKKGNALPLLKGAYIDGGIYVGENQLDTLASIKSKNELIGDIIGLLQSPAKNVVSALQSSGGKLAGILKTLSEKE